MVFFDENVSKKMCNENFVMYNYIIWLKEKFVRVLFYLFVDKINWIFFLFKDEVFDLWLIWVYFDCI